MTPVSRVFKDVNRWPIWPCKTLNTHTPKKHLDFTILTQNNNKLNILLLCIIYLRFYGYYNRYYVVSLSLSRYKDCLGYRQQKRWSKAEENTQNYRLNL